MKHAAPSYQIAPLQLQDGVAAQRQAGLLQCDHSARRCMQRTGAAIVVAAVATGALELHHNGAGSLGMGQPAKQARSRKGCSTNGFFMVSLGGWSLHGKNRPLVSLVSGRATRPEILQNAASSLGMARRALVRAMPRLAVLRQTNTATYSGLVLPRRNT